MGKHKTVVAVITALLLVGMGATGLGARQAVASRAHGASTLTISWYQEPDSVNPAVTGSRSVSQFLRSAVDTLVWLTPKEKIVPDLAVRWKITNHAKTYYFWLRKGVKFQDGTPFNAKALVANFAFIMNPATKSLSALSAMGPYKSSRAVGPYEVQVNFSQPYAAFLPRLGQAVMGVQSLKSMANYAKDPSSLPITTGPYQVTSFTPNNSVVMKRNPHYNWAPPILHHKGPASIGTIVLHINETSQARLDELQSGQAQLADGIPGVYFKQYRGNSSYREASLPLTGVGIWSVMNTTKWPTNSKAVRQAIMYYVNRPGVMKLADDGVYPVSWGPIQKGTLGYFPQFNSYYHYNPKRANSILAGAGWRKHGGIWTKNGRKMTVSLTSIANNADYPALAQAIQGYLTKAGIQSTFTQYAITAWENGNNNGVENMTPLQWTDVDPDALRVLFTPGHPFSWAHYNNPKFNKLVQKAAGLPSMKARLKMYYRAEKMLMDDAVMMPLHYNADLVLMSKSLQNVTIYPQGGLVFLTAKVK